MVDHVEFIGPPELTQILLVALVGECLQVSVLAVEILDSPDPVLGRVVPHQLPGVARSLFDRNRFGNAAGQVSARFVAYPGVAVFLDFRTCQILIGEFTSHEGPGAVRRTDSLHPLQRRKVQPLVVRLRDVSVNEERGSLHVPWIVEHEQDLVSVPRDLKHLDPHRAFALLSLLVSKDHGHVGGKVVEAPVGLARRLCNLQPLFTGGLRHGTIVRRHQHRTQRNESNERE